MARMKNTIRTQIIGEALTASIRTLIIKMAIDWSTEKIGHQIGDAIAIPNMIKESNSTTFLFILAILTMMAPERLDLGVNGQRKTHVLI